MTLAAGELFAGYTIVRQLGGGGMGEVDLGQHPRLPRRDALQVLRTEISSDDSFRQRFIRESDSIAALEHPHIVAVYDRGDTPSPVNRQRLPNLPDELGVRHGAAVAGRLIDVRVHPGVKRRTPPLVGGL